MDRRLLVFLVGFFLLPLTVYVALQMQQYWSKAASRPARLVIDTTATNGPFTQSWAAFAQGGEEPPPMLDGVAPTLQRLSPQYIRLDHIFDYYQIVQMRDGVVTYDFSRLDTTVDHIRTAGALPFFSLSYMPAVFTTSGSVIDPPRDWNLWKDLIRATIQHYSGADGKNLENVYYEVWNEPELPQFGGWKLSGDKDYRMLYFHAAQGAAAVSNAQTFFFGGPGVGSYYPQWINGLSAYASQNNLRFDFYSWHRYHTSPDIFTSDVRNTRQQLSRIPKFTNLPLIISEWGIDSENTSLPGTNAAAAFTVNTVRNIHRDVSYAFQFEVKDGPPPNGGRWGLMNHQKGAPALGLKPRFYAFEELARLKGENLQVSGEGTHVQAMAGKSESGIRVLVSNYDRSGRNTEYVPIVFSGLPAGSYDLWYRYPLDGREGKQEIIATNGTLSHSFVLAANTLLALELSPVSRLATFVDGVSGTIGDRALTLANGAQFVLTSPEFRIRSSGTIRMDIQPFWKPADTASFVILDMPFGVGGEQQRLYLAKQRRPEGHVLSFGLQTGERMDDVVVPIDGWVGNQWRTLSMGWDQQQIWLAVGDEQQRVTRELTVDAIGGKSFTVYPVNVAIDNLEITLADQHVIRRNFDTGVDQ